MNYVNAFISWFSNHPGVLIGLGISSILIFILSILGISWFIAQIPEDYFLSTKRKPSKWQEQKPILRLAVIFGKNIIGFSLIIGGLLMLVLPGQGLLTIVTGLLLVNYPGKYKLEKKLVAIPSIFRALNWIRVKANKPPLKRNAN
jgi:archaellum biogenesis protein FlaJ (TadC family)|tara:strand:+ start:635 stop:1069 length:435 start_codon:yes stop_codon:yes gene_type:complete